ncbi:BTAD domain-containing putative transcriptional regulator [Longispora sp. K20-0274]|uniref:AfsR/SARP family transcriptional regulator n=1 Tax=Longispora sp. K20-0274 TaxID=3088255 RepID=UPI00399B4BC2
MGFDLLGPVRFEYDGQVMVVRRRQERCGLCLLLLEAGRAVPVERLLELLWDGRAPASSRATVHTYIARLRRMIAPTGLRLETKGAAYLLDVDRRAVDVHRFSDGLDAATRIADPAERLPLLRDLLALWRGPLMADTADDALRERLGTELEARRLTALELHAQAQIEVGLHACDELLELVRRHPTRERLVWLAMLALYRSGRQAHALEIYRRTRTHLVEELGIEPSAELRGLHERMLRADPTLSAGEVATPRREYLPRDVPDFTGRAGELRWLDTVAGGRSPVAVVSAISGTGGMGKTALAVHWAHAAMRRFPDGQLYLDLRGHGAGAALGAGEAVRRLLRMLGLPAASIPDQDDEAAALYRARLSARRMLIVLDNAASARQVRPLLPGGPGNLVVVTSRDRLAGLVARDGAHRLDLDSLTDAEAEDLVAQIIGPHRTRAEPQAAAAVIRICGGLPLALRIAATNLAEQPGMTLRSWVDAVADDRLDRLAVDGDPDSAVRAVFALSLARLADPAAVLFRRLGLLPVTEVAPWLAADLTGGSETAAADLLGTLRDASLLSAPRTGARFVLHDLVQLFAREQADADDLAALQRSYRSLLGLALHADAELPSKHYPTPRPDDLADRAWPLSTAPAQWLADEWDLLVGVARDCVARGWPDLAWRMVAALTNFASNRSYIAEWTDAAEAALAAAPDGYGAACLLLGLGGMMRGRGEHTSTAAMLGRARRLFARHGDDLRAATAASQLSMVYRQQDRVRSAQVAIDWAIARLRDRPPTSQLGQAYVARGNLLTLRDDPQDLVSASFEQAAAVMRAVGDLAGEGHALTCLASSLRRTGDPGQALVAAERAAELFVAADDEPGQCAAALELGRLHLDTGDIDAAWTHVRRGLADARDSYHPRAVRNAVQLAGEIALHRDDLPTALALLAEATELSRALGQTRPLHRALLHLSRAHAAAGDVAAALRTGEEALAVARTIDPPTEQRALTWVRTLAPPG